MKGQRTKGKTKKKDDSLFGLLSTYKAQVTYLRVLINEDESKMVLQLTDNPGKWPDLNLERWQGYRMVRRLELDIDKMLIKYIYPWHLIKIMGPLLGIKVPPEKVMIENSLQEENILSLHFPLKYSKKVFQGVKKLVSLTPQKKYEILEKCIIETQEE